VGVIDVVVITSSAGVVLVGADVVVITSSVGAVSLRAIEGVLAITCTVELALCNATERFDAPSDFVVGSSVPFIGVRWGARADFDAVLVWSVCVAVVDVSGVVLAKAVGEVVIAADELSSASSIW